MRIRSFSAAATIAGFFAIVASPAGAATSLVTNGDFEAGSTGWNFYGAWGPLDTPAPDLGSYQGNFIGSTSCNFSCPLDQILPTETGQKYNLSFAYNAGYISGPAGIPGGIDLQVYWDGVLVKEILGGPLGWSTFSLRDLAVSSSSTELQFVANHVGSRMGLDLVSVTAVPEPDTWLMLIFGFVGVGVMARLSRRLSLIGPTANG